jgi:hypothetical protein
MQQVVANAAEIDALRGIAAGAPLYLSGREGVTASVLVY